MKSAVRSSAERSTTPAATAAARCSAERAPVVVEVFFVVAQAVAKGRAEVAEGSLPEVVMAAGATSPAAVFFVVAQGVAKGRAEVAKGPLPEAVMAAGATSAAAGVGGCTAAQVEAFAEAAETRAVSAATEGACVATEGPCSAAAGAFAESAHHFAEAVAHFAVAAQAAVPPPAVGSDGRHRVSLPRDAAADRRERGEDLTRTDVRFAVEELDFME